MSEAIAMVRDDVPAKLERVTDVKPYLLGTMRKELVASLPEGVRVTHFVQQAWMQVRSSPDLMRCTPASITGCVLEAASLGLMIGGPLGLCYLVPFQPKDQPKKAQLIIGYKGYVALAHASERVSLVTARPVYDCDDFKFRYGTKAFLHHEPGNYDDKSEVTHAWSLLVYRDGAQDFLVYNRKQLDALRVKSYAGRAGKGPWGDSWAADQMFRKAPLRALLRDCPVGWGMGRALALDSAVDAGQDQGLEVTHDLAAEDVVDVPEEDLSSALEGESGDLAIQTDAEDHVQRIQQAALEAGITNADALNEILIGACGGPIDGLPPEAEEDALKAIQGARE